MVKEKNKIIGALAELQVAITREITRECLEPARTKGRKDGRPPINEDKKVY